MDGGYSFKAVVKEFNGTSWVNVGIPGFSSGEANWINLAFNPVNWQPYVVFSEYSSVYNGRATVMKFNGSAWVLVGIEGFSPGETVFTTIAFNTSGEPYVAFGDAAHMEKASVMKFNGASWINVGNPGFSPSTVWFTIIAFSPLDGLPYVAYIDGMNEGNVSLMKFNGTSWAYVGNGDFYLGAGGTLDFGFSPSGIPYVSFQDAGYSGKATVMKYDTICSVPPVPTITGLDNACINSGFYDYSTETGMTNYQWNISPGGIITSGQGSSVIQVTWDQAGNQWVSVSYMNNGGCMSAQTTFPVMVDPLPDASGVITGSAVVCAGSNDIAYSVPPVTNAVTYVWTLPSGAIIYAGNGTNSIIVTFTDNSTSGCITVYGNNLCGNGATSPPFDVTVNPIPATPIITEKSDTLTSSSAIGNQWYYNGILLVNDTNQNYLISPYLPGYYWTQVTLNGCFSDTSNHIYYNTIGINNRINPGLSIFPNPVTTNLNIELANTKGTVKFIEIYGTGGNRIFNMQTDNDKVIVNVAQYPAGIYFVKVRTESSNRIGKFCKD